MKLFTRILFTGLFLSVVPHLFSTHLESYELSSKSLGNGQFQIFAGVYLDCDGGASQQYIPLGNGNANVSLLVTGLTVTPFGACTFTIDTAWQSVLIQDVTPVCPTQATSCSGTSPLKGIAYFKLKQTVSLTNCAPGTNSVTFTISNCCRPGTITTGAANDGIVAVHTINPQIDNTSPDLVPLSMTICDGKSTSFYVGGFDEDYDSLVYTLAPAISNASTVPYTPINYGTGFSSVQPLGTGWNVSLNSSTGILTCTATPGGIQKGVIGVLIEEYRNGALIGSVLRDLTVTVVNCGSNAYPTIQQPTNISGGSLSSPNVIDYCIGSTLSFDIVLEDSNQAQILTFQESITKALPGATISATGTNPLTLTVDWTSTLSDTANRHFFISAQDNACVYTGINSDVIFLTPTENCVFATVTGTNCQDSTGSIITSVPGSTGPFTYLWSTGDTTSTLTKIPIGSYWVQVTNTATGAAFSDTFLLTADDVLLSAVVTEPDCSGGNGSISLSVSGGTAPYTYAWNSGATTDTIGGLTPGGYNVIVTDSIGCFQQATTILGQPDSCFVTLSGTVYHDANGNCQQDSGETGLSGILVDVSPGGMVLTDSAGGYSYQVDTSASIVTIGSSFLNGQFCPDSILTAGQPLGSLVTGLDFGIDTVLFPDLEVYLTSSPAIWNGSVSYFIQANNIGTISSGASVKTFTYPSGITFLSAFPSPLTIDTVNKVITWNVPASIPPGSGQICIANFSLDSTLSIWDSLVATAKIGIIPGEGDTLNNSTTYSQIVVAAYDPNDKQPTPAGIGAPGFIPFGTETIDYKIRFQNTGNYPASYVELRDTLSPELDLNQYRTLGNSHPFSLTVEKDSIMVFTFANINLPDSTSDPDGSQGFVEFQIGIDPSVPVGTEINNQAAIYFDFNPPIFTNTTRTTLYTQPGVAVKAQNLYCVGDEIASAITATGMPPYTYSWSSGKNTTKNDLADTTLVFQSGWYVLTVTDDFGFTASDSILVDVTPNPTAAFEWDFTGNGFEIAFADSSQDGISYFWDFGINGQTSSLSEPVFTFPSDGVYEVMMVVTNDCGTDTAYATIEIRNDGLEEWPFGPVSLYPNPTSSDILVQLPLLANWRIRLLDSRGQLVMETITSNSQIQLDLEEFSQGIYLLEVSTGTHRSSHRVIKR